MLESIDIICFVVSTTLDSFWTFHSFFYSDEEVDTVVEGRCLLNQLHINEDTTLLLLHHLVSNVTRNTLPAAYLLCGQTNSNTTRAFRTSEYV